MMIARGSAARRLHPATCSCRDARAILLAFAACAGLAARPSLLFAQTEPESVADASRTLPGPNSAAEVSGADSSGHVAAPAGENRPITRRPRAARSGAGEPGRPDPNRLASPVSIREWLLPGLLIAGLGVTAWLLRRRARRTPLAMGDRSLEVLTRLPLSSKQSVTLVRLGHSVLVLGVGPDRISTLAHVTDSLEVVELVAAAAQTRHDSFSSQFSEFMKSASAAFSPGRAAAQSVAAAADVQAATAAARRQPRGPTVERRGRSIDAAA